MLDIYDQIHEWLVQEVVLQAMYFFDWMGHADDADLIADWFLLGIVQIFIIAFVLRPLEKKEEEVFHSNTQSQTSWLKDLKQAIRIDIFYSSLHRLGLFQLMFFMLFSGVFFYLGGLLHDVGFLRLNIESWIPSFTDVPVVSFLLYLVLFDLIDYGYHRLSHHFNFWWRLHALHHSQRHMTAWSDNRNHLVDDLFRAFIFSGVGLFLGVQPSQFLMLIVTSRLIQSWQHGFYPYRYGFLKYLIVTPNFHRYHHAIDLGYEVPGKPGILGGCNFGVLFPWWDMMFKTAQFDEAYYPSGVRDFSPPNSFIQQQWLGLKMSWQSFFKKV